MTTPSQVVERLSFTSDSLQNNFSPTMSKENTMAFAHPPVAPPPILPTKEDTSAFYNNSNNTAAEEEKEDLLSSYQHARPHAPRIRNYNDPTDPQNYSDLGYDSATLFRGDPNLRPNIGLTNSYDYALFGWTWIEMISFLRRINLATSTLAVVNVAVTWILDLVRLQVVQLVVSLVMAALSLALWITEIFTVLRIRNLDDEVYDRVGLLYHPLIKSAYLVLLATLCWFLHGWWSGLLGMSYLVSALLLLSTWLTYPDFRQAFAREQEERARRASSSIVEPGPAAGTSWSYYSTTVGDFVKETSERASLLGSSLRRPASHT
jgi:hypothetical protein